MPKLSWLHVGLHKTGSNLMGKFNDATRSETRRIILNRIYREPRTSAQIADDLGLSRVVIAKHLKILLEADLIKEVDVSEERRQYKQERYYTVNFPVLTKKDEHELEELLREIGEEVYGVLDKYEGRLREILQEMSMYKKGWRFEDLAPYLPYFLRLHTPEFWSSRGIELSEDKPYKVVGFENNIEEEV